MLRVEVSRVLACLAALALVLAVVRGGSGVFYCAPMQAVLSSPCCAEAHEAEDHDVTTDVADEGAVIAPRCCQAGRLALLAPSPLPAAPLRAIAASPLATVLPRIDALASQRSSSQSTRGMLAGGAGPPTARERRAALMVFHL